MKFRTFAVFALLTLGLSSLVPVPAAAQNAKQVPGAKSLFPGAFGTPSSGGNLSASDEAQYAETTEESTATVVEPLEEPEEETSSEVRWNSAWGKAQWYEAALAIGLLMGPSQIFNSIATSGLEPTWTEVNDFDQSITDAIGAETETGIDVAEFISDIPFTTLMYYPIVIDSLFTAWYVHDNAEVAINTGVISLLSLAIVGSTIRGSHLLTRRERPKYPEDLCSNEPDASYPCEREALSMPSGHTAIAFNGAGLICATHEKIPLYGGGFWDTFACAAALTGASVTGVARVVNRDHHATDNIVGAALGLTTGYVLPKLFHYGFGSDESEEASNPRPSSDEMATMD